MRWGGRGTAVKGVVAAALVAACAGGTVALAAVGSTEGESVRVKPDRARPSAPSGIRVNSSLLSWTSSVDNVGVAGYEVQLGSRTLRVGAAMAQLRGLRCGTAVPVRVIAFDRAGNRSRPARSTVRVAGCSLSTPGWFGSFDTGDLSEWDVFHVAAPERYRAIRSEGGVVPRLGSHMARVEVRGDEPAPWTLGANVSLAEKSVGPLGTGTYGSDVYWSFSIFLPKGFPYVPNHLANIIAEWHGDNNGQAAMHFTIDSVIGRHYGISNTRVGFVADLHLEPFAYRPKMWRLGDLVTGRWVDLVFHMKWHSTDGLFEGWMDGVKKFSHSGPTWPASTSRVKPQLGYYRAKHPETAVLYVDGYKIGASYEAVAP